MSVGDRIRQVRKEKGFSVEALAEHLGKDRATVYRYESNDIKNMPSDVLVPISKVLDVSPAYLLGLTDDKNFCMSEAISLDDEEAELIRYYRGMSDEGQRKIREYVADLYDSHKYNKTMEA